MGEPTDTLFFIESICRRQSERVSFHQEGTLQAERDALKDSVLRKIGIPLLRLSTRTETGREGEKLRSFLLGVYSLRKGRGTTIQVRGAKD